jgi:hypothetical protein
MRALMMTSYRIGELKMTETKQNEQTSFARTLFDLAAQVATVAAMVFVASAVDAPRPGDVFVRAHVRTLRRF